MPRNTRKPNARTARRTSLPLGTTTQAERDARARRFERIKNDSARGYVDKVTGDRVSKRTRDTFVRGGVSNETFAKSRKSAGVRNPLSRSKTFERAFQADVQRRTGKRPTIREVQRSDAYRDALRTVRNFDPKRDRRDASSPMARALVALGVRREDWTWAVGETNADTVRAA